MAVPAGIIVAWAGTVGSIPSGWSRVTALDEYFIRCVPDAVTDPGTTHADATNHQHSSTHTHTQQDHTHSYETGNPDLLDAVDIGTEWTIATTTTHHHLGDVKSDKGTNQNTVVNTSSDSYTPKYTKVIFIQSDGTPVNFPQGAIIIGTMDVSSKMPDGWVHANGTGGSPDMRNRFMLGADASGDGGAIGGTDTHVHTTSAHNHTQDAHGNIHDKNCAVTSDQLNVHGGSKWISKHNHKHSLSVANATPTNQTTVMIINAGDHTPKCKIYPFIYFTGAGDGVPNGCIAIWHGTLANIPLGWKLCDGTGGTPNLLDHFVKCANTLDQAGQSAGSDTHIHTTSAHTHTQDQHRHSYTVAVTSSVEYLSSDHPEGVADYGHKHSGGNTGYTVAVNDDSAPNKDSQATCPAHYEIAFIMRDAPILNHTTDCYISASLSRGIGKINPVTSEKLDQDYQDIALSINQIVDSMKWISPMYNAKLGQVEPPEGERYKNMIAFADGETWNPPCCAGVAQFVRWNGTIWVKMNG